MHKLLSVICDTYELPGKRFLDSTYIFHLLATNKYTNNNENKYAKKIVVTQISDNS